MPLLITPRVECRGVMLKLLAGNSLSLWVQQPKDEDH